MFWSEERGRCQAEKDETVVNENEGDGMDQKVTWTRLVEDVVHEKITCGRFMHGVQD